MSAAEVMRRLDNLREQRAFEARMGVEERYLTTSDSVATEAMRDLEDAGRAHAAALEDLEEEQEQELGEVEDERDELRAALDDARDRNKQLRERIAELERGAA